MEVVQQIGSDSFDPGHGVLISKIKNSGVNCGGTFTCFAWIIDSHPEDINHSTSSSRTARRRSRRSATSASSTTRRSTRAWTPAPRTSGLDEHNRLHFYVVDKRKDARRHPALQGRRASRSTAPARRRAASRCRPPVAEVDAGQWSTCTFALKNTGVAAATDRRCTRRTRHAFLGSDVYRLSAAATGTGWAAQARATRSTAAKFGETVKVPVYVTKATGAGRGHVSLTATSESDPSETHDRVCASAAGDVGGSVPATLSLTLGTPASFGAVHAGRRQATTRPDHGQRDLHRRRRDADGRRPVHHRHRASSSTARSRSTSRCRPRPPARRRPGRRVRCGRRLAAPTALATGPTRSPTTR